MALKVLMLRKQLEAAKKNLEEHRAKKLDLEKREAELEVSIAEVTTTEEEATVDAEIEAFESDKNEFEKTDADLQAEVERLEKEIKEKEEETNIQQPKENNNQRSLAKMETRRKFFGMTIEERGAFFAREDNKSFFKQVRELRSQQRGIQGAELTVPDNVMEIIREQISDYSKLMKYVSLKKLTGTTRQNILGTTPEAVWTEMTGNVNEVSFGMYQIELDGFKVAAYIPISNAILEDSDLNLASEIVTALSKSLGFAVDKAILYGSGVKMPLGCVTRLAQETKPSDYSKNEREWKNLTTTNIIKIAANKTGADLYKEILAASSAAESKYSQSNMFWAMNKKTLNKLKAEALTINAAGVIVSGQDSTMPIIGGNIETLDFIKEGDIIGGYGDNYTMVERAGTKVSMSEHVRFLEEETLYKATARYDGKPAIAEAFIVLNIKGAAPATTIDFAKDTANETETPVA